MECDVLVAGGGSAGLAAAVAAARGGARTLLIERSGALGGMASLALVHSICGLYLLREESGARLANLGFPAEFAGRLLQRGDAKLPERLGRVDVLFDEPTAFAQVAAEVANREPLLDVRLHTEVVGAEISASDRSLTTIEIERDGICERVTTRAAIDATGDAVLAQFAGVPVEQADSQKLQRPAFIFSLKNVEPSSLQIEERMKIAHRIASAVREGELPRGALGAGFRKGIRIGEVFVTIDLEPPDDMIFEPTNSHCLAKLVRHGRDLAFAVSDFLRRDFPAFAVSEISALPEQIGIRESRRVIGEYVMRAEDLLQGAQFPDAIALATWPMELRERATGSKLRYPETDRPCEIPLRALRAATLQNFFVVGRAISATHEAHASLRVIGTCLATGEASGLAAALLARGEPLTADAVNALRERVMLPVAQDFLSNEHC